MPIRDLVGGMNDVPEKEAKIAAGLPYRDYRTLGVLVRKLNLENKTKIKTIGNIVPDNWVYVHDRNVQLGRFQIYNNCRLTWLSISSIPYGSVWNTSATKAISSGYVRSGVF